MELGGGVPVRKAKAGKSSTVGHGRHGVEAGGAGQGELQGHVREFESYPIWKTLEGHRRVLAGK